MLILSRKSGESFLIGDDIEIIILDAQKEKIKVGIVAPPHISIMRKELKEIEEANFDSANSWGMVDCQVIKKLIK